jgi:hypothetical protein
MAYRNNGVPLISDLGFRIADLEGYGTLFGKGIFICYQSAICNPHSAIFGAC